MSFRLGGVRVGAGLLRSVSLLNRVGQFVGQQVPPNSAIWTILPCAKHHVLVHRIGNRIYASRGFCCSGIGVYPHLAEITPKPRFEVSSRRCVERMPRRPHYLVHDGWCLGEGNPRTAGLFPSRAMDIVNDRPSGLASVRSVRRKYGDLAEIP